VVLVIENQPKKIHLVKRLIYLFVKNERNLNHYLLVHFYQLFVE
jgi:hypothetical protein